MNYDNGAGVLTLAKTKRKSEFFKAQNRIAYLMFAVLLCELIGGVTLAIFELTDPQMFADDRIKETVNGLVYIFYMLTPSLIYLSVQSKKGRVKHAEKPKDAHPFALFLFGLGIVYVGQLASFAMASYFGGMGIDLYAATEQTASSDPVLFAIQIIHIALIPAILEELLARHIILTELVPYGRGFAVMVSALMFSLMHMNPIQMPFAFISGLAMAYTTVATGSVIPTFFLHFINNALSIILTFLPSFTDEKTTYITDIVITFAIMIAGAAAGIYLLLVKRKKKAKEEEQTEVTYRGEPAVTNIEETAEINEEETTGESIAEAEFSEPEPQSVTEDTQAAKTAEEKAAEINVIEGGIISNISPAMRAYIIAALVCTLLTFFLLWGGSALGI